MMSTIPSIAQSVLGILANPQETENKVIRIHNFYADYLDVVQAVEELTDVKYGRYTISTEEVASQGRSMVSRKEYGGAG